MLSYHASGCPHPGHRDAGSTIDCFRGTRWMQTFRKLPASSPNRTTKMSAKAGANSIRRPSPRRLHLPWERKEPGIARDGDIARRGVECERRARRVERDAREQTPGADAGPGDGLARMRLAER